MCVFPIVNFRYAMASGRVDAQHKRARYDAEARAKRNRCWKFHAKNEKSSFSLAYRKRRRENTQRWNENDKSNNKKKISNIMPKLSDSQPAIVKIQQSLPKCNKNLSNF